MFLIAALATVAIQNYFMIFYELIEIISIAKLYIIIYYIWVVKSIYTKQKYTHNLNLFHVHFGHSNSV